MKTMRKPLSILMAICLLAVLLPAAAVPALADPEWVDVSTWSELKTKLSEASTNKSSPTQIKLTADVYNNTDDSAPLTLPTGKYAKLDLNDHYILQKETGSNNPKHQNVITVNGGLTLTDTAEDRTTRYLRLYSSDYNYVQEVYTEAPSNTANCFSVSGGFIAGGYISAAGGTGGVIVSGSGSSFTMEGGTICGNAANPSNYGNGGGVYVNGGTFTLTKVTDLDAPRICNNKARYGGGVYLSSGTFNMTGGVIENNTLGDNGQGGGVYVHSGTFTMEGGTISSNTAVNGGGVYFEGTTCKIKKTSVIELNSATYGGGVTVAGGACSVENGSGTPEIRSNTATYGGGVYISGGYIDVASSGYGNGRIINNTATNGGGIYLAGGVCRQSRSDITGNHAAAEGGGVYVYGGTFYYHNFATTFQGIRDNTKGTDTPSGIYLKGTNFITLGSGSNSSTGNLAADVLVAKEDNSGVVAVAYSNHNSGKVSETDVSHLRSEIAGYHVVLNENQAKLVPTYNNGGIIYTLDATAQTASVIGYAGDAAALVIPAEVTKDSVTYAVTSIANFAFRGNTTITSATIPDSVTSWGNYIFAGCTNLASVVLPDGMTAIPGTMFSQCSSLENMIIPSSVTSVGGSAFQSVPGPIYMHHALTISNYGGVGLSNYYPTRYGAVAASTETAGCTFALSGTATTPDALATEAYFVAGDTVTVTPSSGFTITAASIQGDDSITVTPAQDGSSASFTMPTTLTADVTVLVTVADASSNPPPTSGTCGAQGDNLTWTLESGVLTVSGTGDMADFYSAGNTPWANSMSAITAVVIEDGVTSIGTAAFNGCSGITSLTIGSGMTTVSAAMFSGCTALQTLSIAEGAAVAQTSIGSEAFKNFSSLTALTIGSGVTSIGKDAFNACTGLTSVSIPDSVSTIQDGAFAGCTGLQTVIIGSGVKEIQINAFGGCSNVEQLILLPNDAITLNDKALNTVPAASVYAHCKQSSGDFTDDTVRYAAVKAEGTNADKLTLTGTDLTPKVLRDLSCFVAGDSIKVTFAEGYTLDGFTVSDGTNTIPVSNNSFTVPAALVDDLTITATVAGIPVESVTLNKTSLDLTAGGSEILTATVLPEALDKTVTWTTSDAAVATVSDGTVTAVAAGTATITATAGEKSAVCAVTVTGGGSSESESGSENQGGDVDVGYIGGGTSSPAADTKTETLDDGSTVKTTTNPDGSTTVVTDAPNGAATTEKTDKEGELQSVETALSGKAVEAAAASGEPILLPTELPAADSAEEAVPVQITLPAGAGEVKVEIPVEHLTPGTVAAIVKEDGSVQILPSFAGENGLVVTLEDSAAIVVFDNAMTFPDVKPDDWFAEAVAWVTARGIMQGTGKGFEPNEPTSRYMLLQMLWNLSGGPAPTAKLPFSDVPEGQWYSKAVAWAAEVGLVRGYEDGSFGGDDPLTREQTAAILYNFAEYMGYDVSAQGDLDGFPDGAGISAWAKEPMAWAVGAGIIGGTTDAAGNIILDGAGGATRAQIAAMIQRFCEKVAK